MQLSFVRVNGEILARQDRLIFSGTKLRNNQGHAERKSLYYNKVTQRSDTGIISIERLELVG